MSNLQSWVQAELRRQSVRNLSSAIAAADGLLDFKYLPSFSSNGKQKVADGKKSKRNKEKQVGKRYVGESSKQKAWEQPSRTKNNGGCFICNGPLRVVTVQRRRISMHWLLTI